MTQNQKAVKTAMLTIPVNIIHWHGPAVLDRRASRLPYCPGHHGDGAFVADGQGW